MSPHLPDIMIGKKGVTILHFILTHTKTCLLLIFLASLTIDVAFGGLLLYSMFQNPEFLGSIGTWVIGIIGALSSLFYFLVDRRRDIKVLFTLTVRSNTIYYKAQAYNDSKMDNSVMPSCIFVSEKEPTLALIRQCYKDEELMHSKGIGCFSFSDLDGPNTLEYLHLKSHGVSKEILIDYENFAVKIGQTFNHELNNFNTIRQCYLSVVFSDISDEPYIFRFLPSNDFIQKINESMQHNPTLQAKPKTITVQIPAYLIDLTEKEDSSLSTTITKSLKNYFKI